MYRRQQINVETAFIVAGQKLNLTFNLQINKLKTVIHGV